MKSSKYIIFTISAIVFYGYITTNTSTQYSINLKDDIKKVSTTVSQINNLDNETDDIKKLVVAHEEAIAINVEVEKIENEIAQAKPSNKERIREIISFEVESLTDSQSISQYIEILELRALSNGIVTAQEIEPGLAAIHRNISIIGLEESLSQAVEFERRMEKISNDMEGIYPHEINPLEEIDRLSLSIAQHTGEEQRKDIEKYLEMADTLEPDLHISAIKQLKTLLSTINSGV